MSKRSDFKRRKNDAYMTWDHRAVDALLPYLPPVYFCEPCCGDGDIIRQLEASGNHECANSFDIKTGQDALSNSFTEELLYGADYIITNPPWTRHILHPMIEKFSEMLPTWLLFDADWMHTKQAIPYLKYCQKIVSVGRLRWIKGTKMDGKDNCAWYLFDKQREGEPIEFVGRAL